jgi:ComF family protein
MINRFLRIFFSESCPVCKKPSTDHKTAPICPDCWQAVLPYKGHICQRCGTPLVSDVALTCGECLKDEPAFKSARSFGLYEGVLKMAINLFKYHRIKRLSKPLSDIILQTKLPPVDAIISVPLYKKRLRQREFNQSALFAKHLACSIGKPLILNCLIKTRDTMPQVGLSAKERGKNIRKTFAIGNKELIGGKNIMLIDDVYTTGATVRECSKVLKKAGAKDIYVITLAHSRGD